MFAIRAGLLRIVQVSLLGSILSNMLLVLGCAFFFGGLRYPRQTFNKTACALNSGMLTLSVMSAAVPLTTACCPSCRALAPPHARPAHLPRASHAYQVAALPDDPAADAHRDIAELGALDLALGVRATAWHVLPHGP